MQPDGVNLDYFILQNSAFKISKVYDIGLQKYWDLKNGRDFLISFLMVVVIKDFLLISRTISLNIVLGNYIFWQSLNEF